VQESFRKKLKQQPHLDPYQFCGGGPVANADPAHLTLGSISKNRCLSSVEPIILRLGILEAHLTAFSALAGEEVL